MTEYKVMAKSRHGKRYVCYGHHTDSYHADKNAISLVKSTWSEHVKIIVDDGYTKDELKYK